MGKYSTTEIETHEDCGWRWDFNSRNRLSLEPVTPLKALWLGTLIHKSLDMLATSTLIKDGHKFSYSGDGVPDNKSICSTCGLPALAHLKGMSIYDTFAMERYDSLIEYYRNRVGVPPTSFELKEVHDTRDLGRAMFKNYLDYYGTPIPDEFEYISTEQLLIIDIPGTEHCVCATLGNVCTCEKLCRPWREDVTRSVKYTFCMCIDKECPCRVLHQLETTLDGLIRRKIDNWVFILENKTFSLHPTMERINGLATYPDLQRNHQFMTYTWAGNTVGFDIKGIFYNGLWKRLKVPEKKTMHDMFTRAVLTYKPAELLAIGEHTRIATLRMGDPYIETERNVKAVGGCNGVNQCNFKRLCDARFSNTNYEFILRNNYTKREQAIEDDEE